MVKNTPTAFQFQRFLSSSSFASFSSSVTIIDSNNNININVSTRISSNSNTSLSSSSSLLMLMLLMRRQSSSFSRRINNPLAGTTLSIGSTKSKHFCCEGKTKRHGSFRCFGPQENKNNSTHNVLCLVPGASRF